MSIAIKKMATHLPAGLSSDSVDTITELTSILVKLRATQAATTASATVTSILGPLGGPSGATPAPAPGAVTGTTPLPSGTPNTSGNSTTLNVKGLPAATDDLKHKLQRARAAVKTLPDVLHSQTLQENEIRQLEERRRRQLAMLARIKAVGLEQNKGDDGERMVE